MLLDGMKFFRLSNFLDNALKSLVDGSLKLWPSVDGQLQLRPQGEWEPGKETGHGVREASLRRTLRAGLWVSEGPAPVLRTCLWAAKCWGRKDLECVVNLRVLGKGQGSGVRGTMGDLAGMWWGSLAAEGGWTQEGQGEGGSEFHPGDGWLEEAQAGIKTAGRNINNLR